MVDFADERRRPKAGWSVGSVGRFGKKASSHIAEWVEISGAGAVGLLIGEACLMRGAAGQLLNVSEARTSPVANEISTTTHPCLKRLHTGCCAHKGITEIRPYSIYYERIVGIYS